MCPLNTIVLPFAVMVDGHAGEIKELGGEDHGTIRASVLEHMADTFLARVDDDTKRQAQKRQRQQKQRVQPHRNPAAHAELARGSDKRGIAGSPPTKGDRGEAVSCPSRQTDDKARDGDQGGEAGKDEETHEDVEDDDEFDRRRECQEAATLLGNAVAGLHGVVHAEIAKLDAPYDGARELEEDGGSREAENDDGCSDSECGMGVTTDVLLSLAGQLAGLLHKLIQTSVLMAVANIDNAKIGDAVATLHRLVPHMRLWIDTMSCLSRRSAASTGSPPSSSSALWGSTMTFLSNLPICWSIMGELCREILHQTAGVSLQDAGMQSQLQELITTLRAMNRSILPRGSPSSSSSSSYTVPPSRKPVPSPPSSSSSSQLPSATLSTGKPRRGSRKASKQGVKKGEGDDDAASVLADAVDAEWGDITAGEIRDLFIY